MQLKLGGGVAPWAVMTPCTKKAKRLEAVWSNDRGFARQPCCMAETMKMFCIRKNIFFSYKKKNLLFLPCNMAAVQNLYSPQTLDLHLVLERENYGKK